MGSKIASFQFTHPGKGATVEMRWECNSVEVSIHAPWEGCDRSSADKAMQDRMFQFTHPGKGATKPFKCMCDDLVGFQFTHPGKGAT